MSLQLSIERNIPTILSTLALTQISGNAFYPATALVGISLLGQQLTKQSILRSSISMGLSSVVVALIKTTPFTLTLFAAAAGTLGYSIYRHCQKSSTTDQAELPSLFIGDPEHFTIEDLGVLIRDHLKDCKYSLDSEMKDVKCLSKTFYLPSRITETSITGKAIQELYDCYRTIKVWHQDCDRWDHTKPNTLIAKNYAFLKPIFDGLFGEA